MGTDAPHPRRSGGVLTFVALAFGLAWAPFVAVPFGGDPAAGMVLMPIAPAVACLVVRRWVTREGFGDAGLRPTLRHWPMYLLALAWPVAATSLAVVLSVVTGIGPDGLGLPWGVAAPGVAQLAGWVAGSLLLAPFILGEELGWRGFLQLRLFPGRPMAAAVAVGALWGVWHHPMILAGGQPLENRGVTLVLFPVATTSLSVLLGWMRARTGSIWPGTVAHAANNGIGSNLSASAFTGSPTGHLGPTASAITVAAEAVVLLGAVALGRRRPDGTEGRDDSSGPGVAYRSRCRARFASEEAIPAA